MPDERMLLNDVVKYLMKTTGRTRRQAERLLIAKLKSGEVKAEGIPAGGVDPEPIPTKVFQSIPWEN
jgi:hypothetical protein